MKKSFLLLLALAAGTSLYSAAVSIEIDGTFNKIKFSKPAGIAFLYPRSDAKKDFYLEFRDTKEPPLEWKEYTVSFIPEKSGYLTFGLSTGGDTKKGMDDWVEYDKLQVINAELKNPSFEFKSTKDAFWAWRYYTKASEKIGKDDAPDGKNYIAVTRDRSARQGMRVTAGKMVTIKFLARSGGLTPRTETKITFFADHSAPKAK